MMYPQAELENYKLQVELLQEKLHRSEENRQNLEHKLDNVLKKRHEIEQKIRSKTRQRYQEFLDEQQKRNERNKMLLEMLERVDQQTTALSARSERLKMMKLQYEMYFAKLVQNQTMRCIQQAATPAVVTPQTPYVLVSSNTGASVFVGGDGGNGGGGVALPTSAPTQANVISIKRNELMATPRMSTAESVMPAMSIAGGRVTYGPTPTVLDGSDGSSGHCQMRAQPTTSQSEMRNAFAYSPATRMANQSRCVVPTSATSTTTAGMSGNATTTAFEQFDDYNDLLPMNRNISNLTRNSSNDNIDEMPTLRALDNDYNNVNDYYGVRPDGVDVARRRVPGPLPTRGSLLYGGDYLHATENDNGNFGMLSTAGGNAQHESEQLRDGRRVRRHEDNEVLSTAASHRPLTIAELSSEATAMTFDKLPKMTMTRNNLQKYDNEGARCVDNAGDDDFHRYDGVDDIGMRTETQIGGSVDADTEFALPNPRNASTKFAAVASANIANGDDDDAAGHKGVYQRQKIDEARQSATTTPFNADRLPMFTADLTRIKNHQPGNAGNISSTTANTPNTMTTTSSSSSSLVVTGNEVTTGGFTVDDVPTAMARPSGTELRMEASDHRDDSKDVKATAQHLSQSETVATTQSQQSAKMSFENIENAIYGELVNPPDPPLDQQRQQGLLEALVTTPTEPLSQPSNNNQATNEQYEQPLTDGPVSSGYANYPYDGGQSEPLETDATTSSSYNQEEPSYATIGGTTNAEVYQQPPGDTSYSSNNNSAVDYPPYNGEEQTAESQQLNTENPQEYSNVDYGNYDPDTQYDPNAYDPNAYPGYTYDVTTGEYTVDPSNQYAPDDAYASQAYDAQQYNANQQDIANYDYSNYAQAEAENAIAETYDSQQGQPMGDQQTASVPQAPVTDDADVPEMTPMEEPVPVEVPQTKVTKPTSILSTAAEKQAADKKKKRVNFVESSDTDESAPTKAAAAVAPTSSESDFEFSSSGEGTAGKTPKSP